MKTFVLSVLIGGLLCLSQSGVAQQKIVTAAQVNGTWQSRSSTFKIWALGKQKLKVEFSGVYEYKTADGLMANVGEGIGIAFIEGETATFKPEGAEDECLITLQFGGGRLEVKQESICGFGHNVTATGKYRKVNARKPQFGAS
ncbi:MAG: hypothetical protein H7Z75_20460 [Ferruginibacter sp.]|nr:hypothetical protein [Cytophagales bacterium]